MCITICCIYVLYIHIEHDMHDLSGTNLTLIPTAVTLSGHTILKLYFLQSH
jgi:hypothetical protein